jgi:hypothetical protein
MRKACAAVVGGFLAYGSLVAPVGADSLIVDTSPTAAQLVVLLVGSNPGISVVPGSPVLWSDTTDGTGSFTGASSALPFDAGILLTTGDAEGAVGPNSSPGYIGDGIYSLLSFKFIPTGDTISFQYVFGSEEYEEYVLSMYNDAFSFKLNGQNIALVPGTSTPIEINTVNYLSNTAYYFDNTSGLRDIQYDGLVGATRPLYATGKVNVGQVNRIDIYITDVGDDALDSGVFLKAGSFVNTAPPEIVPLPAPLWGGLALVGGLLACRLKEKKQ